LLEQGGFNNRTIDGALPGVLIGGCDQGAAVRWVGGAMAAIGGDDELGFGPCTVQRPGAFHGADDIVTALHKARPSLPPLRSPGANPYRVTPRRRIAPRCRGQIGGAGTDPRIRQC
jgi:hypothetical protein